MKILVFGANGMIGHTVVRVLSEQKRWEVFGTIRTEHPKQFFPLSISNRLLSGVDLLNNDSLVRILDKIHPDIVINCAGLTKHKEDADDPLLALPINSLIPHRLANLCRLIGARLIHISTDCVFSGMKGNYSENDFSDARDIYGKSKSLGEINHPNTITLRTSTIGHELQSKHGLLEWFLSQNKQCKGYSRAVFSGFPTVVLAEIIRDFVIPKKNLSGLFNVAANPINKYDLLQLIAKVYVKEIEIIPEDSLVIDRSLNGERFHRATGYNAPSWPELVQSMFDDRRSQSNV